MSAFEVARDRQRIILICPDPYCEVMYSGRNALLGQLSYSKYVIEARSCSNFNVNGTEAESSRVGKWRLSLGFG